MAESYNTSNYRGRDGVWHLNGTVKFGADTANVAAIAGVTAGTVAASKAVIVDSNKDISAFRNVGLVGLTFGVGGFLDADSGTATCSTNAATLSKMAGKITTEALTTAALASQAITITNTTVAATDMVYVTVMGGTNTRMCIVNKVVPGTGSFVVTLTNIEATDALNGTVVFGFLVVKA